MSTKAGVVIKGTSAKTGFRLLTALFFMWGFITVMNDLLINTFKGIFELTAQQSSAVQMAFFGAFFIVSLCYFLISAISGKDPVNLIGYANGMVIALVICGIGCLLFYQAANSHLYSDFLRALFILATGVTFLQICANPYAAILGPVSQASARLNLAQGLNSLGTTIGPLIGLFLIYKLFADGTGQVSALGIAKAYLIYGGIFLLLAVIVFFKKLPTFENKLFRSKGIGVLRFPHLLYGVLAIFFYVGAEVSVGSWLVEFIKSPDIGGLPEDEATYFLSFFWGGLMIGRLLATFSLDDRISSKKRIVSMLSIAILVFFFIWAITGLKWQADGLTFSPIAVSNVFTYLGMIALCLFAFQLGKGKASRSLVVFAAFNIFLLIIAIISKGQVAVWALIGTGLFFSVGWSNIFTLSIRGLGEYTSQGSSLLVMAIVGGALIPRVQAYLIDAYSVQFSLIVPIICMIYILFFGFRGFKTGDQELDRY